MFAECGDKRTGATPLIVGGAETEKYEFPWVAAVYVDATAICSATIITPYHVLSGWSNNMFIKHRAHWINSNRSEDFRFRFRLNRIEKFRIRA